MEIETNEKALVDESDKDLVFPESAIEKNFLYTLDAEGNKVNVPAESLVEATKLADGDGTLVYTYASKGLPEPKETLRSWLADEANARKEASEASNYTRRSWQAYNAAYDRAEALMKSKLDRDQSVYEDAFVLFQNIQMVFGNHSLISLKNIFLLMLKLQLLHFVLLLFFLVLK